MFPMSACSAAIRGDIDGFELMFAVGNLRIGSGASPRYDARRMVEVLVEGLRAR
jgi:hypothetical protein